MNNKKVVIFDLWETLIFGTEDSAISLFYNNMTGDEVLHEQLKNCMLIKESEPRVFLEEFLNTITPSNVSSMMLSLKNPRSPLFEKIIGDFKDAIDNDSKEIRWLPGAVELLEKLKDKYTLVLVSNLWAYQKEYLFSKLKLDKYFDQCLFSCDIGVLKGGILQGIEEYGRVKVNDAVFIGRSYEYDIIPAVNSHISSIRLAKEDNIIDPDKVVRAIDEELNYQFQEVSEASPKEKGKKRVLITIPPFFKLLGSHNNRLNLSASHLSAWLDNKGYENSIYHCDSELKENYITRYQMVFNSIKFYEAIEENQAYIDFEKFYSRNMHETVFITCGDILNPSFDSGNWDSTKKIAKIVRKLNPSAHIIAIGPEIGSESEDFDLLVSGEVENIAVDIIEKKTRGKVRGSLLPEEKLEGFPEFNMDNIVTPVSPVSLDTLIWRRGCYGRCDFCRVAEVNQGTVRAKSMEAVIKEMKNRHESMGINDFYITDANFTSDRDKAMKFCRMIRTELPEITWRTESRFDTLDVDLLKAMKKSGCTHIKLGLENALHEKHQVKTKKVSLSGAADWIKIIQEDVGIKCIVYLMLGGKWFTPEQYNIMYDNTSKLNASGYTVSLFTPYPNTPSGISDDEWKKRKFTGSHLDIRLIDFWKIPIDVIDRFFSLELLKGREDKKTRQFVR